MLIHCHALGLIMAKPKDKGTLLSVGAKSHVEDLAKQHVYGYRKSVNTKEIQKGQIVENESIALLNEVLFKNYRKNTERRTNDWLTGECDIHDAPVCIHDVKSSWSLSTFPATPEDGKDSLYEWQMKAYMMLWDVNEAEVDYCLVDTPDELIGYEPEELHRVSHIDPVMRVTRVPYVRNMALESLIIQKCEAAQQYYVEAIEAIYKNH